MRQKLSRKMKTARMPKDPAEVVKRNTPKAFDFFWASDFAKTSYMTANRRSHAQYVASLVSGDRFLDVGCGDGTLLGIVGHGIGVDYSAVSIEIVNELGFDAYVSDAKALPFADESFDCVACIEVLEHSREPQEIANELSRVLCCGGTLIVGVPDGSKDSWDGHISRFSQTDIVRMFSGLLLSEVHVIRNDFIITFCK